MNKQPKRVVIKVSGECLNIACPRNRNVLEQLRADLAVLVPQAWQIVIVVGGGNILRGRDLDSNLFSHVSADHSGMLATIINALLLGDFFNQQVHTTVYSSKEVAGIVPIFYLPAVLADLQQNTLVVCGGGTGNIAVTSDTAAALRAIEINACALYKLTTVEGIYDPQSAPENRIFFRHLTFQQVLDQHITVMDKEAFLKCQQFNIPICIANMYSKNILARILLNQDTLGTWIN